MKLYSNEFLITLSIVAGLAIIAAYIYARQFKARAGEIMFEEEEKPDITMIGYHTWISKWIRSAKDPTEYQVIQAEITGFENEYIDDPDIAKIVADMRADLRNHFWPSYSELNSN